LAKDFRKNLQNPYQGLGPWQTELEESFVPLENQMHLALGIQMSRMTAKVISYLHGFDSASRFVYLASSFDFAPVLEQVDHPRNYSEKMQFERLIYLGKFLLQGL
jgi:hypothetical protein